MDCENPIPSSPNSNCHNTLLGVAAPRLIVDFTLPFDSFAPSSVETVFKISTSEGTKFETHKFTLFLYIQVQFVYSFQSTRHPIMSRKLPSYPKKHMTVPKQVRPDFKKKFLFSSQKNGEKYHHVPMDGSTLQHSITYHSISNTNGIMTIAHAK